MIKQLISICTLFLTTAVVMADETAELFISRHAAKIVPKALLSVPAETAGELEICHFGGKNVEAGTVLARLNPKEMELERRELEQQITRNNLEAEGNILKLQRELEELDFIAGLDEKQRPFVEQRTKTKVDERARDLLQRRIDALREQTEITNEKLRLAFDKTHRGRELRMPYKGIVQYHIPLPDETGKSVLVNSGAPILTVADDSVIYIAITLPDPDLAKLDASKFRVRLMQVGGGAIHAAYSFRRIEKQGQNEQTVYYFEVPQEAKDSAWELAGANVVAELYYLGGPDWLYESKLDLATEAGKQPFSTWDDLIAALRPEYVIVFCGETHLALQPYDGKSPRPEADRKKRQNRRAGSRRPLPGGDKDAL